MRKIITSKIEHIHKDLFGDYSSALAELVGRSQGVYALYHKGELYYVGKAVHLIRRVGQHLKDKHAGKWSHFSIFLTNNREHVSAIESVLISVAYPEGNTARPKGDIDVSLRRTLMKIIQKQHKEKLDTLIGHKDSLRAKKKPKSTRTIRKKTKNTLAHKFASGKTLRADFKDKQYKAKLLTNGNIKYASKTYTSPTAAAMQIVGGRINGMRFWRIKNKQGEWVRLKNII